jgi:hypothetical protein
MKRRPTIAERLDRYTRQEGECHVWTGARDGAGYGKIWVDGSFLGVHRLVWVEKNGPIPAGLFVCHKCDVRTCINPDHLWLGPPAANNADMWAKGRGRSPGCKGKANGRAKLTDDQVRVIRAAVGTQKAIGAQYGVNQTLISKIRLGKSWSHVHG